MRRRLTISAPTATTVVSVSASNAPASQQSHGCIAVNPPHYSGNCWLLSLFPSAAFWGFFFLPCLCVLVPPPASPISHRCSRGGPLNNRSRTEKCDGAQRKNWRPKPKNRNKTRRAHCSPHSRTRRSEFRCRLWFT